MHGHACDATASYVHILERTDHGRGTCELFIAAQGHHMMEVVQQDGHKTIHLLEKIITVYIDRPEMRTTSLQWTFKHSVLYSEAQLTLT